MTVYSTRLVSIVLQPASSWVTILTVPTGYRNVLKFVSTTQVLATGGLTALALSSNGLELFRAVPDTNNRSGQAVTIVLHEGEVLLARAYVNQSTLHISGYQLTGSGGPNVPATLPAPR